MMELNEMFQLQGMPPGRIVKPTKEEDGVQVTDRHIGLMVGNAFEVNLMARVMSRLFLPLGFSSKLTGKWGANSIPANMSDSEGE